MEKEALSKYVAYKRKALGLTQKDLAALLSYTPQAVSRFESVNSAFPLEFSDSLCKALDCSLDDLFLRTREKTHYSPLPFSLEEVGNLLEEKRKEKGLDQESVAFACDITSRSLRNYESGKGSVSLQFLDIFCETLAIKPSDLARKELAEPEPEIAPLPVEPARKRPWILLSSLAGATSLVAGAIVVAFLFFPSRQTPNLANVIPSSTSQESSYTFSSIVQSNPEEPIPSSTSQESSYTFSSIVQSSPEEPQIGKYGLEIEKGTPNFLKVQYDRNTFKQAGDSIKINLSDAYDDIDFDLTKDSDFRVDWVCQGLSFSYKATSKNEITLTMLEGRNGEGTALNIHIRSSNFMNVGFFYCHNDDPVYLPSDTKHRFPIDHGMVHSDFKTNIKVIFADTNYVAYKMNLFSGENILSFDEGISPEYMVGDAYLVTSRAVAHNFPPTLFSGLGGDYVEIPKPIEIDVFMITGWVKVEDDKGPYWYALEPLTVQIIR